MFSCVNFVIPPSKGNVAGIERVTLMCANGIRVLRPELTIRVHMFGQYDLPADLSGEHIYFHPDCHPTICGRFLGPWLRDRSSIWVVCQPMATLSLCLWHPLLASRLRLLTVLHGALHIEMRGFRKRLQYKLFGLLSKSWKYRIAAVSESLARFSEEAIGLKSNKVVTLLNPVLSDSEVVKVSADASLEETTDRRFTCVAIGRLDPQKGFDILIPAYGHAGIGDDSELKIFGEGPDRAKLERLIEEMPRPDRIKLMGYDPEAKSKMRACDLFIMSSRYEGLSGALIEAVAARRSIICTDHLFGAREALANGELGTLVTEPFRLNLSLAIADAYARWKQGRPSGPCEALLEDHLKRFTTRSAVSAYLKLLDQL